MPRLGLFHKIRAMSKIPTPNLFELTIEIRESKFYHKMTGETWQPHIISMYVKYVTKHP